jgi:hypothetical protein
LTPEAGTKPPAAGSSVEVPTGTAEAPAGAVEVPPALKEEEVGLLQIEVSSTPSRTPPISKRNLLSPPFASSWASLSVPDLAPIKVLKLRTSLPIGRRSERAPRVAVSMAAAGEPSCTTTAAARLQREGATVATLQALVPHDPRQGRWWGAHSESQSIRGRSAIEAHAGGDSVLRRASRGGHPGKTPSSRARCWWCGSTAA